MYYEPGSLLGIYEILEPLGAGVTGEVYRARDPSLGRDVAIKVIRDEIASDASTLEKIERDVRSIASLSHPNIVAIHSFAREDAHPYVVMELLDGETLRERLGREKIPWRDQAAIGASIADGLNIAHQKGVIHRNLKPENVFLTNDGLVKIVDFGLAAPRESLVHLESGESSAGTNPTVIATVAYMSPEQIRGEVAAEESDIFTLGCILHEMATGQLTFARATTTATMAAILDETQSEINDRFPRVPGELARTIARCLEKRPEERFHSARDLAFSLRTTATSDHMGIPQFFQPASSRWRMLASGALVLALAATTFYLARPSKPIQKNLLQPTAIRSIAVLPFDNEQAIEATEFLADGITEGLINSLSQIHGLRVVARHTAFTYKGTDLDLAGMRTDLNVDAVLTGKISVVESQVVVQAALIDLKSEIRIWGERYTRQQKDLFTVETEIVNQIATRLETTLTVDEESRLTLYHSSNPDAYEEYLRGRLQWNKRNVESLYRSVDHFRGAIRLDPGYAAAWSGLADAWTLLGSEYSAVSPAEGIAKARDAARRALEIDHRLAAPHASLGLIEISTWNWDEAEAHLLRAIELNPNYPSAHQWYGILLRNEGRVDEALQELEKARELDPRAPIIAVNLASCHLWNGDLAQAVGESERSLALDKGIVWGWYYLGESNRALGNYETARNSFQMVIDMPGSVPHVGTIGLALVAATEGKMEEAHRIVESVESQPGASSALIAGTYVLLGDYPTALTWLERAVETRDPFLVHTVMGPPFRDMADEPRYHAVLASMDLDRFSVEPLSR